MKALWIFIGILIAGCSSAFKIDNEKLFEVNVDHIEIWFDAMPKVESKSKFYIDIELSIKNLSCENVQIDSLFYDLVLSSGEKLTFVKENFSSEVIQSGELIRLKGEALSSEFNGQISGNNRNADLYVNIYFMTGNKKNLNRIYLKSQEFEIVY